MHRYVSISGLLVCLVACRGPGEDVTAVRIATAERFFRGVYGCDSSVVDELASDDVVVSYPIFKTIFGTPSIRGRAAVRKFASGFCERWAEPHITIHESVGEKTRLSWYGVSGRAMSDRPDSKYSRPIRNTVGVASRCTASTRMEKL